MSDRTGNEPSPLIFFGVALIPVLAVLAGYVRSSLLAEWHPNATRARAKLEPNRTRNASPVLSLTYRTSCRCA